jgi:hypothetical protein
MENSVQLLTVDKGTFLLLSGNGLPQLDNKPVVVHYLKDAPRVASVRTFVYDEIMPDRRRPISLSFHSDGEWVWSSVTTYYVEEYDLALPEAFLRRVIQLREPPESLADSVRDDAMKVAHESPEIPTGLA